MRRRLRFLRLFLEPVIFAAGLVIYGLTKRTPRAAAVSLRRLYVWTDGRLNDAGARASSLIRPPRALERADGVLGRLDADDLREIAREIDREGFVILDAKLDSDTCRRIIEYSLAKPAMLVPRPADADAHELYDRRRSLAPRYEFEEQDIFGLSELQELASDETLMALAQAYLQCNPTNDLAAMWWSPSTSGAPSSEAAQMFHFDMDRLKFIKFFVYLTDVDSSRGPHVFVQRSHVRKPKALRRDGRISDEEIVAHYGRDAIIEITGEQGTILAVDTRGFHKGKAPERGDRLLFQVEYANSLFGMSYNRIFVDDCWSEGAKQRLQQYPHVFRRFEMPA